MLPSLTLWARYNLATDEKVHSLLTGLGEKAYSEERNTYFRSLGGLHLHYVQTYRFYLGLLRQNWGNQYLVSPLTDEGYEVKAKTLDEVSSLSLEYDRLFLAFLETVKEADLAGPKTKRTMRSGRTLNLSMGDVVLQIINHTAHHRGQLSQILDELGIEHDFGGILAFAEEVKE
jgi:uncharacterized damage-inducible protein DinB